MTLAPNQLQMSERSRAGYARGARYVQALVADYQPQDRLSLPPARAGIMSMTLPNFLKTCPGLRGSGLSHSRSDARTSRCCVRKRVCLVPPGQTRVYSLRLADCSPFLRHTLPVKQLFQSLAYRNHHQTLSSVARLVGIDPKERRLTNAQRSFAPGAKAND